MRALRAFDAAAAGEGPEATGGGGGGVDGRGTEGEIAPAGA